MRTVEARGAADDKRDARGILIKDHGGPQPAIAEHVAVVGREDDNRVILESCQLECL